MERIASTILSYTYVLIVEYRFDGVRYHDLVVTDHQLGHPGRTAPNDLAVTYRITSVRD
jgi:hypothetical protein